MAVMPAEERDLVRDAAASDAGAFALLVDRYRDAVYAVAYHHLGNREDAQDAAQETFVRAYLGLRRLRDPERFAPWLKRIAANVSTDLLRRRREGMLPIEAAEDRAAVSAGDEDPERVAARLVVRDALARLSEPARLAVTLFYMNGYSQAEIARFLDVPVSTISSRLQHARQRLREEMIGMVEDVLQEGKPDPAFTRQVVDEALRRAQEAQRAHEAGEALRHLDEALAAIEQMEPGEEQLRLKMDALWRKGTASSFPLGGDAAAALYEDALAIAEQLGDRQHQSGMLQMLGVAYANLGRRDKAEEYYGRAQRVCEELGDAGGQAYALAGLGSQHLFAREAPAARACFTRAQPLFETAASREWVAICRAACDFLVEVGEECFAALPAWGIDCNVLGAGGGRITFIQQPGYSQHASFEGPMAALRTGAVFYQLGRLETILDPAVPVGGTWSGASFSYSCRSLCTTVTVRSDAERVTVPAGSFEGCLLVELVTVESGEADEAPHDRKELNRKYLCGTRRAWWAPGVGLVQLQVQTAVGPEALIQLQEYRVAQGSAGWLPLAVGNEWRYTWPGAPAPYHKTEFYRVTASRDDHWYLESYGYVTGPPPAEE